MALNCRYENEVYLNGTFYVCKIVNQSIPNCELSFYGVHDDWKCDDDVQEIRFTGCSIHQFPKGVAQCFPYVKDITIRGSRIKNITRNDLADFNYLKRIDIHKSQIEFLPGDLFKDLRGIESIEFELGSFKIVDPKILNGINNLKYVSFRDRFNYTKLYSIYEDDEDSTTTLSDLKFELREVFRCHNAVMKKQQETETVMMKTSVEAQTNIASKPNKLPDPKKDISYYLKIHSRDDRFRDFKIRINDREFHVHKFVLAARSPTLAEVLLSNPEVENLNLFDIPDSIFEMILNYMYNDELPKTEGLDVLRLYAVAGRLKIEELIDLAAGKLIDKIDGQNALEVFKLSSKYEHSEIKKKAFEMVKAKYPKLQFLDSCAENPDFVEKVIGKFEEKEKAMKMIEEKFLNDLKLCDYFTACKK